MEIANRPPLPQDASPQEKYDNLILTFYEEWQQFDGDLLNIREEINRNYFQLGFKNEKECSFYVSAICKNNLLSSRNESWTFYNGHKIPIYAYLTFEGLKYCLNLLESGKNSNRCFVAMAFHPEMESVYEQGIRKAIENTGFRAIRVDKAHTENEQTINDFIIASIKQSRFCIADLTHQRNGVYFEAGYALGRGLKVIYTCHKDDHKNVHFDLKTMQTILYNTPEELCDALTLKIQAVILD